jgi:hypothetical protein
MNTIPRARAAAFVVSAIAGVVVPTTASASGLGKFVQGVGQSEWQDCEPPTDANDAAIYRLRSAALLGWSALPAAEATSNSLYVDAGYRFWNTTTGCQSRSGLFGSKNWSWHSLSIVASSDINITNIDATTFAPQIAWEVRRESRGGLFDGSNAFTVGLGATVGPYLGPNDSGMTAAVLVRALIDFRLAANWSFDDGLGWSAQLGLVDPHIMIWRLFFEDG